MRNIVACMITIDRTLFGKENYLGETLRNLDRSGFFGSAVITHNVQRFGGHCEFDIYNSHDTAEWIYGEFELSGLSSAASDLIMISSREVSACINAGQALEITGHHANNISAKWVLFLEDDLDFCADFLGSVGRYLDKHGDAALTGQNDIPRLVVFGCPYPQVTLLHGKQWQTYPYPIKDFYGTQCFAIRPSDAISLGRYLQSNPLQRNPNEYDLMIHDWMALEYPAHKYFLASVPSFVEHIGRESICTSLAETHRNPSWPGRDWKF